MHQPGHHHHIKNSKGLQLGANSLQENVFISLGGIAVAAVLVVALVLFGQPIRGVLGAISSQVRTTADRVTGPTGKDGVINGGGFTRASVDLVPASGAKTAKIRVKGENFEPGEDVAVSVGMYESALVPADADGGFSTRITIPGDAFCPSGQCTVHAQGKNSLSWNDAVYTIS